MNWTELVVVVVYWSIFLSTDTFIMSIGKHENLNACVMIRLKCRMNQSKKSTESI